MRIHGCTNKWIICNVSKINTSCEALIPSVTLKKCKEIPKISFILNLRMLYVATQQFFSKS